MRAGLLPAGADRRYRRGADRPGRPATGARRAPAPSRWAPRPSTTPRLPRGCWPSWPRRWPGGASRGWPTRWGTGPPAGGGLTEPQRPPAPVRCAAAGGDGRAWPALRGDRPAPGPLGSVGAVVGATVGDGRPRPRSGRQRPAAGLRDRRPGCHPGRSAGGLRHRPGRGVDTFRSRGAAWGPHGGGAAGRRGAHPGTDPAGRWRPGQATRHPSSRPDRGATLPQDSATR